jgi:dTDP-4-dehydrorhamnose reductase
MRALVVGDGGMLAEDLVPHLIERGHDVLALSEGELDINDETAIREAAANFGPTIIFNCAAYTQVDQAEKEQLLAEAVNGLGVRNLCLVCKEHEIPLVHFSTDYVFDGTKETPYTIHDNPNPTGAYGRSKLLGEQYLLHMLSKFYLLRTSWLFGLSGWNFVEAMLDLGQRQGWVRVVQDERGCPTWTKHLAEAATDLAEKGSCGIYHVTNSGATTWYDFAVEIFCLSGIDVTTTPITAAELDRPARRPANSVLDPHPLPQVLGREMPTWQEALGEYLKLRKERGKT